MEDGNSAVADDNVKQLVSRFSLFCKERLASDEKSCKEAILLLEETKLLLLSTASFIGDGTPEEAERHWFAFIIYFIKRLTQKYTETGKKKTDYTGLDLCRILRAAKLNVADFFEELPQFVGKAGPILSNIYGADWENWREVKEMHANANSVIHLKILRKYYRHIFGKFFVVTDASEYYRFGWLIFLALRVHAFGRCKDLMTYSHCLTSILAILIIHVPARFRNFNIDNLPCFVKKNNKGVDLFASLCIIGNTSKNELRKSMEKANNLITNILKKKPCLASECVTENLENFDTDGLTYFEDLMEESALLSNLNILEKYYDVMIHIKGELDERLFLNEENNLSASGSMPRGTVSASGVKRKFDSMSSPATTVAHWLFTIISPLATKPSQELEQFLISCDMDVTGDVVNRAQIILQAIFPSGFLGEQCVTGSLQSANLVDNIWVEQRRVEALKLYYRVLEAMCRAEAQTLHVTNLTSLLTNERFHRCVLVCSAELVMAAHNVVTMLFPAVLERTGITALDLSMVIESFIRHEESLTRELTQHLNSLEERLLENMVWEKGSWMYNSLAVAQPALSAEINYLGLLAEPMPSLDEISMHINLSSAGFVHSSPELDTKQLRMGISDHQKRRCTEYQNVLVDQNSFTPLVKDRLLPLSNLKLKLSPPPLQSAFASPTKLNPGSGGEICAETVINFFFGKIIELEAVRISDMVERLRMSQQIRENVNYLFQQILHKQTSLFFNRHIDQIMLCCIYAVAKNSQRKLAMREVIHHYAKQSQFQPQLITKIFVDWSLTHWKGRTGREHISIIRFYNEVFIHPVSQLLKVCREKDNMKSNRITKFDNKNDGHLTQYHGSLKISHLPSVPDWSDTKVSATCNVDVSPLQPSTMDDLVLQLGKLLCLDSTDVDYITAINNHLNGMEAHHHH